MNVYVDDDEVLGELSDKQLLAEVNDRGINIGIPLGEKSMQLQLAAIELRKMGNVNYAVWLEDIAKEIEG